jgi:hypothetical protein
VSFRPVVLSSLPSHCVDSASGPPCAQVSGMQQSFQIKKDKLIVVERSSRV